MSQYPNQPGANMGGQPPGYGQPYGAPPPKSGPNTALVVVIVVLVMLLIGGALYVFVLDSDDETTATDAAASGQATPASGGQAQPTSGGQAPAPPAQRNPGGNYTYGIYERVDFPAGSTGTTVSGGTVTGTVNGYVIGARANQEMVVKLVSPNASYDLYAPDDSLMGTEPSVGAGDPGIVRTLPSDGDYLVVVGSSGGGNASYDLMIEINDVIGG